MSTFSSYPSPGEAASRVGVSAVKGIDPNLLDIVQCEVQLLGFDRQESTLVAAELIYAAKILNPTDYKKALRNNILTGLSNQEVSFDKKILDIINRIRLNESKLDKESVKEIPESVSRTILY